MRDLVNLFIRYSTALLLLVYVVISCILLFRNNPYQGSVFFTSANSVTSGINGVSRDVTGYFNLKSLNKDLMTQNARLENEVLNLKEEIKKYKTQIGDSVHALGTDNPRFGYILANVLNNSTRHKENYFTINKGSNDGIEVGMGVADFNGVVGIVGAVSPKTSRVISLLHTDQPYSAKLKGTNYVGSMIWKANDPKIAYLSEIPRHAVFHTGDTVVTTGFSSSFPEGITLGIVENTVNVSNNNYTTIKLRLASDFSNLTSVRVINDTYKKEIDAYNADKDADKPKKNNKNKKKQKKK